MPRTTRAALRSQELAEEPSTAATIPLPGTPYKERVPLGEIADNPTASIMNHTEENAKPTKKGPAKAKKGRGAKKGKKQAKAVSDEPEIEVLEDPHESSNSSAAEEASQDLSNDDSGEDHVIVQDSEPAIPLSPAAKSATNQLSPATTHSDQVIPASATARTPEAMADIDRDINSDNSCQAPGNMTINGEQVYGNSDEAKEDSFIEAIKTRTPAKRVSRIEDSVEALDAFEEEIEKVGQSIPAAEQSPVKARKQQNGPTAAKEAQSTVAKAKSVKPTPFRAGIKAPVSKTRTMPTRSSSRPAADTKALSGHPAQGKHDTNPKSPTSASEVAPATKKPASKRVSSVHKAPFQPTKSTKPPTRANFELPGEAISRKLKEQREERQKREEEENSKQRIFKARPVRLSQAPEVKLTATTRARLSMAKNGPVEQIPKPVTTRTKARIPAEDFKEKADRYKTRISTNFPRAREAPNQRLSSLTVQKRPATTSTTKSPTASTPPKPTPSTSTTLSRQRSVSLTANELDAKRKGKEAFDWPKKEIRERENSRREKEEAAKKARAVAAERGRLASREWAERQKARKMAAAAATVTAATAGGGDKENAVKEVGEGEGVDV